VRIPVFVSCPSDLSESQNAARQIVIAELRRQSLEPRALGRSDYPTELPLREVLTIARHCSGGVILGFEQVYADRSIGKRGTTREQVHSEPVLIPTPWNHLEAGILFGLGLPLLVFREDGVAGGVFDHGVTDAFVHRMPTADMARPHRAALTEVFRKWQSRVRARYYGDI
jgi:hypothetical protein